MRETGEWFIITRRVKSATEVTLDVIRKRTWAEAMEIYRPRKAQGAEVYLAQGVDPEAAPHP